MKKLLLLLSLVSCKPDAAEIAMDRFPDRPKYCSNSKADGVVMCSYKGKVYICYTMHENASKTVWCLEAIDPLYLKPIGNNFALNLV